VEFLDNNEVEIIPTTCSWLVKGRTKCVWPTEWKPTRISNVIPLHLFLHFSGLKLSAVNVLINTSNPSEGVFSFRLTKKKRRKIRYSPAMLSVKKHRNCSHRVKFNFNVPDYPSDFYKNLDNIS
jgi:hypothetical protein